MKLIPLTQGKFAQVDDEDFDEINKFKWYAAMGKTGVLYAQRESNSTTLFMHREIMGCKRKDGKIIDHKNRDGLNCQKINLRFCTKSENNKNRKSHVNSTSKYLGVSWCKLTKKWLAQMTIKKRCIKIGRYKLEEDAALAYNEKAIEIH